MNGQISKVTMHSRLHDEARVVSAQFTLGCGGKSDLQRLFVDDSFEGAANIQEAVFYPGLESRMLLSVGRLI